MNLPKHDLAPPIQVTRPSMPEFEAYVDMIRPLWESRWLSNNGIRGYWATPYPSYACCPFHFRWNWATERLPF